MTDSRKLLKDLVISAILTLILVYLSMGNAMFGIPVIRRSKNTTFSIKLVFETFFTVWGVIIVHLCIRS